MLFLAMLFVRAGNAAPTISSFTPGFGSSTDPGFITITGSGFFPGTLVVRFNGVQDTTAQATAADGTVIQAVVPAGAPLGPGKIFVSVNGISVLSADDFTVIGAGPYITGFSPPTGSAGAVVTISGTHFTGANFVRFNGVSAAGSISIVNDFQIQATAPSGVTTGPISVERTGVGTNTTSTNFFVPPSITSLSTNSGIVGSSLVITGKNFTGASSVKFFNNVSAPFTVNSNTQITTAVPTNAVTGAITIVGPAGSTSPTNFVVRPSILGFSPTTGSSGAGVTINGYSLLGVSVVTFNGTAAAITATNYSQLTVTVPAGATTGPIIVTTTNGTATTSTNFFLPPSITSFTPTNSAPTTTVKITGQNFLGATNVSFNGITASFTVTNNTTIGVTVPNGVSSGNITVSAPGGVAVSAGLFYAQPAIFSFSPTHGLPGTNVTIFGTNFFGATKVQFNGVDAVIVSVTATQIVATAPAALTGTISVTAPAGMAVSAGSFTFDYSSDLKFSLYAAPNPLFVGDNLFYSLVVTNAGPQAAPAVVLTNWLPENVVILSAIISQGTKITNNNSIIASFGTVNLGMQVTLSITVAPQSAGQITNTASLRSGYPDPDLSNNDQTNITLVLPTPVLSIGRFSATRVRVAWPVLLTNFALEYKNAFGDLNWSNDATAVGLSASERFVVETNSGSGKFYRLKQ